MVNPKKLYNRFTRNPENVKFIQILQLANAVGFRGVKSNQKGSHRRMVHPKGFELNFQMVSGGKAKSYQVKQLLDLINDHKLISDEEISEV